MTDAMDTRYDVVVIDGGAAGLSGALMLSRARPVGGARLRAGPRQRAARSMNHNQEVTMSDNFDSSFWESRYRDGGGSSEGQVNPHLVSATTDLGPGTALDAGCGEGAAAIWLAEHGWEVTAVDISPTGLQRAQERAEARGPGIASRIHWAQADLTAWYPSEQFDLVTSHYVHTTEAPDNLFRLLASAVAPHGTLLIVGHDPADAGSSHHDGAGHSVHLSPGEPAATLDPAEWTIEVAETRSRVATSHHGDAVTLHDTVVRAARRS